MSSPYYLCIKGNFVIVGKEPDGDSVRFIAKNSGLYNKLKNANLILQKISRDGSVQLRFEAVDAPELHYGTAAQPLGAEARDKLLDKMGFSNIVYKKDANGNTTTMVQSANPNSIPGAILTQAAEINGRPVSYILLGSNADNCTEGAWTHVDAKLLEKTVNYWLLEQGLAYYTIYNSTSPEHIPHLREIALAARNGGRGVWGSDTTRDFILESQDDISPSGQLILPKLFRRSTDFLKAVQKGFDGNLQDWLIANEAGSRTENDLVEIDDGSNHHVRVRLSQLVVQENRHVIFQPDLLSITFIEK